MKKKCLCIKCHKVTEIEDNESNVFTCPDCGTQMPLPSAIQNYELEVGKILRNANKAYDEAYSYQTALDLFKEYLKYEPDSLDGFIGLVNSTVRISTVLDSHFKDVCNLISNKDLILDNTTYIRLGHFIEQVFISCFIYIRRANDIYEKSKNLSQKAAICKAFWDIKSLFGILKESLSVLTDDERKESFFLEDSDIVSFEDILNRVLGNDETIKIEGNKCYLFINNEKIDSDNVSKDTFKNLSDDIIFMSNPSNKLVILVFVLLGVACATMIAGLITVLLGYQIAGYITIAVGIVLFAGVYFYHKIKHDKYIEEVNKY
jgi:hypothetical protein